MSWLDTKLRLIDFGPYGPKKELDFEIATSRHADFVENLKRQDFAF